MNLSAFSGLIAMAQPVQPGQEPPPIWTSFVPLILMVVVFYFLLIRPQQKKAKEHQNLLKTLRSGDKVITNGGIVGVVVSVKETSVTLRTNDAKIEVLKSSVGEITERGSEAS